MKKQLLRLFACWFVLFSMVYSAVGHTAPWTPDQHVRLPYQTSVMQTMSVLFQGYDQDYQLLDSQNCIQDGECFGVAAYFMESLLLMGDYNRFHPQTDQRTMSDIFNQICTTAATPGTPERRRITAIQRAMHEANQGVRQTISESSTPWTPSAIADVAAQAFVGVVNQFNIRAEREIYRNDSFARTFYGSGLTLTSDERMNAYYHARIDDYITSLQRRMDQRQSSISLLTLTLRKRRSKSESEAAGGKRYKQEAHEVATIVYEDGSLTFFDPDVGFATFLNIESFSEFLREYLVQPLTNANGESYDQIYLPEFGIFADGFIDPVVHPNTNQTATEPPFPEGGILPLCAVDM